MKYHLAQLNIARFVKPADHPDNADFVNNLDRVNAVADAQPGFVWRLVGEVADLGLTSAAAPAAADTGPAALALRKLAHRTLADVGEAIVGLRFNVAVAKIYELANAIASAVATLQKPGANDPALGAALAESLAMLVHMIAPMMPHLAEECWAALGHDDLVATRPWPVVEGALLVEDTITLPVQINGKKRDELTIAANASQADVEAATLALDTVHRALEGKAPRKVVVVPKRIVNVVI